FNPCSSSPCLNNGLCYTTGAGFACACAGGWSGSNCQIEPDPCRSAPCQNFGFCFTSVVGADYQYVCFCTQDFRGTNCELPALARPCSSDPCVNGDSTDPCLTNPCINGGFCSVITNTQAYICTCPTGYSGNNCQIDLANPCGSNPCLNGGTCFPIDQRLRLYPCQNGGRCLTDTVTEYVCQCTAGYGGINCQTVSDPCFSNPCLNQLNASTWAVPITVAACKVSPATTANLFLFQLTRVSASRATTMVFGQVYDLNREYRCFCNQNYAGTHCEISLVPQIPATVPRARMVESVSVAAFKRATFVPRLPLQIHVNPPPARMEESVTHKAVLAIYAIVRQLRWYHCETLTDPCGSNPCLFGGVCTSSSSSEFVCACLAGYTGPICQTELDPCLSNPCGVAGTCC
ncbi:fibropellin-1-like, partial [Strongylocentrotus purpuratus]|uniref:EGF-like domain-containing protein n=1 Tax=Strongylocentrotus purpuratus TaxID=7668 RepID=A0A7M7SUM9_STRPU